MSAFSSASRDGDRSALVIGMSFIRAFEKIAMRERLNAAIDTMIVLAMQVTFRTSMFLRHLNY